MDAILGGKGLPTRQVYDLVGDLRLGTLFLHQLCCTVALPLIRGGLAGQAVWQGLSFDWKIYKTLCDSFGSRDQMLLARPPFGTPTWQYFCQILTTHLEPAMRQQGVRLVCLDEPTTYFYGTWDRETLRYIPVEYADLRTIQRQLLRFLWRLALRYNSIILIHRRTGCPVDPEPWIWDGDREQPITCLSFQERSHRICAFRRYTAPYREWFKTPYVESVVECSPFGFRDLDWG